MKDRQRASVSVEAALVLPIFIYAFLMFWSVTNVIRAQVFIQVGINQAAKELSQYGYILAKAGIIESDSEIRKDADQFKENTDDVIDKLVNFTEAIQNGVETDVSETGSSSSVIENTVTNVINSLSGDVNNFDEIKSAGNELFSSGKSYFSEPKELLQGLVAVLKSEGSSLIKSRLIAAPIGKALMEKYMKTMTSDPDAYLKKLGVVDGIDGLNFNASTLFDDGSTINLTVIYQTSIQYPFFGEQKMAVKLNASTAIWGASLTKSSSSSSSSSVWELAPVTRGKKLVEMIKAENPTKAVKSGSGYDLYDKSKNKFTSIFSLNPSDSSYKTEDDYNEDAILSKLRYYANQAKNKSEDATSVKMDDGNVYEVPKGKEKQYEVYLVIPDSESANSSKWNAWAKQIAAETGVMISITYRE